MVKYNFDLHNIKTQEAIIMDMIMELFYGNLSGENLYPRKSSEYTELLGRINDAVDEISKSVTEEQSSRLLNSVSEMDGIISSAYFSIGFRWGARMMLSMLTDDTGTFEPV